MWGISWKMKWSDKTGPCFFHCNSSLDLNVATPHCQGMHMPESPPPLSSQTAHKLHHSLPMLSDAISCLTPDLGRTILSLGVLFLFSSSSFLSSSSSPFFSSSPFSPFLSFSSSSSFFFFYHWKASQDMTRNGPEEIRLILIQILVQLIQAKRFLSHTASRKWGCPHSFQDGVGHKPYLVCPPGSGTPSCLIFCLLLRIKK